MHLADTFIQSDIYHFMHSLWVEPAMTSWVFLYWNEYLTVVLSGSPVAKRTGGNDPVLHCTLRDGGKHSTRWLCWNNKSRGKQSAYDSPPH